MAPEPPAFMTFGGVSKPAAVSNPIEALAKMPPVTNRMHQQPSISVVNQSTTPVQQAQIMAYMNKGAYGSKKHKRGEKNMTSKSKKNDEKSENKEWDTGFGELYEKINDRPVKKTFETMEEIIKKEF